MTFHWNWCTKAGTSRKENQDYGGIAAHEDFLLAVVTDGVSSRPRSGELARDLVHFLIDRAEKFIGLPTSEQVCQWIKDAFHALKTEQAAKSSTSVVVACFSQEQVLFAVHAGDCRIGVPDDVNGFSWKNQVHSLANGIKELEESELRKHPARSKLTRAFGTKRFVELEVTNLNCFFENGAALVTDGFWAGLPIQEQNCQENPSWKEELNCDDDISRLIVQWKRGEFFEPEAAENFYFKKISALDLQPKNK
jgi:serine/threonine protein phosphatase PrpC